MNKNILTFMIGTLAVFIAIVIVYRIANDSNSEVKNLKIQQKPWKQPNPPVIPPKGKENKPNPPPRGNTFEDALASIKSSEAKKMLYYLASDDLEGRMSGKSGNVTAADWIKKKFESFGLQTEYDQFSISRLNAGPKNEQGDNFTKNIYAWIPGNELPDEIVVVGAHMDHIGYGPRMSRTPNRREIHHGADDNASGTVGLLEIAEALSMLKGKVKRTIVFQSYSAEEMGLIGSRYYVKNPKFPKSNPNIRSHVAMVNMDMIGYLGKGRHFASFYSGDSSIDITKIINELNGKYSFGRTVTSTRSGGSDHVPFYNSRIPVAFLHTGGHAYYHTPDDTADKINYDGIEKVIKYGFELVWKIAQAENRPQFNHVGFKELPYVHDHGHPGVPFYKHSYHRHGSHEHPHSHDQEDHHHHEN